MYTVCSVCDACQVGCVVLCLHTVHVLLYTHCVRCMCKMYWKCSAYLSTLRSVVFIHLSSSNKKGDDGDFPSSSVFCFFFTVSYVSTPVLFITSSMYLNLDQRLISLHKLYPRMINCVKPIEPLISMLLLCKLCKYRVEYNDQLSVSNNNT